MSCKHQRDVPVDIAGSGKKHKHEHSGNEHKHESIGQRVFAIPELSRLIAVFAGVHMMFPRTADQGGGCAGSLLRRVCKALSGELFSQGQALELAYLHSFRCVAGWVQNHGHLPLGWSTTTQLRRFRHYGWYQIRSSLASQMNIPLPAHETCESYSGVYTNPVYLSSRSLAWFQHAVGYSQETIPGNFLLAEFRRLVQVGMQHTPNVRLDWLWSSRDVKWFWVDEDSQVPISVGMFCEQSPIEVVLQLCFLVGGDSLPILVVVWALALAYGPKLAHECVALIIFCNEASLSREHYAEQGLPNLHPSSSLDRFQSRLYAFVQSFSVSSEPWKLDALQDAKTRWSLAIASGSLPYPGATDDDWHSSFEQDRDVLGHMLRDHVAHVSSVHLPVAVAE